MRNSSVWLGVLIVGAGSAAGLFLLNRNAPLCSYGRGQVWDVVDGGVEGATSHEEAVEIYIAAELGTPDISANPIVEIFDDTASGLTVLTENGTVVATFGVEQTSGSGFMVASADFCTDGDFGPFLANTFDPQLVMGLE